MFPAQKKEKTEFDSRTFSFFFILIEKEAFDTEGKIRDPGCRDIDVRTVVNDKLVQSSNSDKFEAKFRSP